MTRRSTDSEGSEDRVALLPWWRVLLEPTVVILLLASVAHLARRNVTDLTLFLGLVAVIAADRLHGPASSASPGLPRLPAAYVGAAAVGYGALVAPWARFGRVLPVVLAIPGLVALIAVLRARPVSLLPRAVPPPSGGWVIWPAILVGGCLFELANFLVQPDPTTPNHEHPVLSDIVDPWLSSGLARGVFAAAWLAIGWWLLRIVVGRRERR